MEYMKTQIQLDSKSATGHKLPFTGVFSGMAYTVRTTGFLSLYNGLGITLVSVYNLYISICFLLYYNSIGYI